MLAACLCFALKGLARGTAEGCDILVQPFSGYNPSKKHLVRAVGEMPGYSTKYAIWKTGEIKGESESRVPLFAIVLSKKIIKIDKDLTQKGDGSIKLFEEDTSSSSSFMQSPFIEFAYNTPGDTKKNIDGSLKVKIIRKGGKALSFTARDVHLKSNSAIYWKDTEDPANPSNRFWCCGKTAEEAEMMVQKQFVDLGKKEFLFVVDIPDDLGQPLDLDPENKGN
jgi:hypothetical protein